MRTLKPTIKVKMMLMAQLKFLASPVLMTGWFATENLAFVFFAFFLAEFFAMDVYWHWKDNADELGRLLDEMEEDDDK